MELRRRNICLDSVKLFLVDKGWIFIQIRAMMYLGSHRERSNKNSRYYQTDVVVTHESATLSSSISPTWGENFEYDGKDLGMFVDWYEKVDMKLGLRIL